ncbi:hypothetical protein BGZ63DRAFT_234555 [Mariannaea sp. PMI_226]|nr:hypothetical protein BGZ63DRAFT_234555 [Mariannaea sp. PMI_226]
MSLKPSWWSMGAASTETARQIPRPSPVLYPHVTSPLTVSMVLYIRIRKCHSLGLSNDPTAKSCSKLCSCSTVAGATLIRPLLELPNDVYVFTLIRKNNLQLTLKAKILGSVGTPRTGTSGCLVSTMYTTRSTTACKLQLADGSTPVYVAIGGSLLHQMVN